MISANGKGNFLKRHYEWLALGVAFVVLVIAVLSAVGSFGEDPAEVTAGTLRSLDSARPPKQVTRSAELSAHERVTAQLKTPPQVKDIKAKEGNFLSSALRIFCRNAECQRAIPQGITNCPYCKQPTVLASEIVYDTDKDGMPDTWEKLYGFNFRDPTDAALDADGDEFTNLEEFNAKTDPRNRASHPDYLDDLSLNPELKETLLPFYFDSAMKTPGGVKITFRAPNMANNEGYGTRGAVYRVVEGEEIGKTGWIAGKYTQKSERVKVQGGNGAEREQDVSTVTVKRVQDARELKLTVGVKKRLAVDVQAEFVYSRGKNARSFTVVAGDEFELSGVKYKVIKIERDANGGASAIVRSDDGKVRTL